MLSSVSLTDGTLSAFNLDSTPPDGADGEGTAAVELDFNPMDKAFFRVEEK